ncbi:perlucin-like protein [Mizuhopecten yessoensis]|uniref:perlucin-like protein n=1 Tax=Mizuhopecten yessoensis TaxID=6573 RepID=UPI000B45F31E|nr:perlucin-like protein [Mizuhopecten yessoensis]
MEFRFIWYVWLQIYGSYQQNILPEHKRRHCNALQTLDIMEHAMPEIRSILQEESNKARRQYEEIVSFLRGSILLTCEAGWVYHDGNCYLISHKRSNWHSAMVVCQSMNAYLAEIRNDKENRFLKTELQKVTKEIEQRWNWNCFLGGTYLDTEGEWIWNNTGTPLGFTDWSQGNPDNRATKEHCMVMIEKFGFQWGHLSCQLKRPYICKTSVQYKLYP